MKKSILKVFVLTLSVILFTQCGGKTEPNATTSNKVFATADEMVADAKTRVQEISSEELKNVLEGDEPYILLDVRTAKEHNKGYIPGSILMPRGVLEFRIASEKVWDNEGMYVPEKGELILIYCKKGSRGSLSADALQRLGYTNVKNLFGGFLEWKKVNPEMIEVNEEAVGVGAAAAEEEDAGGC